MPETARSASLAICEMREYASFTAQERDYVARSLDIALGRGDAFKQWCREPGDTAAIRGQYLAYRELRKLREALPQTVGLAGIAGFMGTLLRISAQDLEPGQITSFSAYRFLYERLLGASARPFLPSAFCGAAALPQIRPDLRRVLLQSLSETAATASGWSACEPCFMPEGIESLAA